MAGSSGCNASGWGAAAPAGGPADRPEMVEPSITGTRRGTASGTAHEPPIAADPAMESPTAARPAGPACSGEDTGPVYSGEDTSQGEIILRTRRRRRIFIGGLVALGVIVILAAIW